MVEEINKGIQSMYHVISRMYEGEKDFQIILDLMMRVRPADHINDYPVKVDLEEQFASAMIRENTRLWFDDEQPIAWVFVDKFNNLRFRLINQFAHAQQERPASTQPPNQPGEWLLF